MSAMSISARYYYIYGRERERNESEFHHVEKVIRIDPKEAALVLVDIWNETSFLDNSFSRRAREITLGRIVPVAECARRLGMAVIHAPSPEIAAKHREWGRSAPHESIDERVKSSDNWPPLEFVRREGRYAEFARRIIPFSDEEKSKLDIDWPVKPIQQDFMIGTKQELHQLLKERNILHLFYAGFYTNMCIQYRDYGVRAMDEMGYNIILLRDCTTAIEAHDTVERLTMTELAIRQIEMLHGFTTTSEQFIRACQGASNLRQRK